MSKNTVKSLIPEDYDLKISSIEELLFLGKQNIQAIARKKEEDELDSVNDDIETIEEYIDLLSGGAGDLKEIAKMYEYVRIPQESLAESKERAGIMEPTREEDKERRMGTTTLNSCPWCYYLTNATRAYECGIEGKCDLLEKAKPDSCDRGILSEGCVITKLDTEGIDCLVAGYKSNIEKCGKDAEKIKRQIKKLNALSEKAEDKPYLPTLRPHDYFGEDDEIVVYASDGKKSGLIEGVVVKNEKAREGFITYQIKGTKGRDGRKTTFEERTDSLLKKDYEYLKAHPDFAEAYFHNNPESSYSEEFKEIVMGR